MLASSAAPAADPFMVLDRVPPSLAAELRPAAVCDTAVLSGPITLARAVERALCANPATRSAWLTARLRAAELGQAYSAYLPGVSISGSASRNGDRTLPNDRSAWQLGLDAQYLLYDFGGRAAQRDAAEALLAAHAGAGPEAEAGVVWLIGAGPGAEDLITLRAQRMLQQADVIVHDQLVPDAVIEMGRRDAERISVGKKKGHHSFTQAQINTLIVRLARDGKRVARLKGGDPMVFGRAGEEVAALRKAGVDYQIVPGVTSALAAAADTATPVTLRNVSPGFVFATAHGASSEELKHWASLAQSGLTLALYMGGQIASATAGKLIRHGAGAAIPVGIVVNAGRPGRALYRGTLGALVDETIVLKPGPAIIFVGEAVAAGDWEEAIPLPQERFRVA